MHRQTHLAPRDERALAARVLGLGGPPVAAVVPSTGPPRTVSALPGALSAGWLLSGRLRTERDVRLRPRLVIEAFRRRRSGKHGRRSH